VVFVRLRQRFLAALVSLVVGVLPSAARDELRFPNGDRISGKVVSREGGKIRFVSEVLGELEVPAANVEVVLNVPDTPVEALAGLPPAAPAKPTTPPSQPVTPSAPAQIRPPPPAAVKPAAIAQAANRWKGKIEAGYVQHSGRNNRVDLSFRGDAEKRINARNRLKAEARVLYAETSDITTNDRYDASLRWRHDISDRLFGQTLTSGYRDKVKQIDVNAEQNFGIGYKFIDRERHVFNIGTGVTAQYRESPRSTDGWAYLIELFQDYTWRINGRITISQNANAFYSPPELGARNLVGGSSSAAGDYRIRFNSTLQGKVTERISMNLRYEYEHDATIVNPLLRDDQRITSSVGYAF
jgi:putative salt-induced outer membrane protein YdiY